MNVLTIPGSERMLTLETRLKNAGFADYNVYQGMITQLPYFGLFTAIKEIIAENYHKPYCIIVEDDILPANSFSPEKLSEIIQEAAAFNPDIILGGIKEASRLTRISKNLLQVHNYRGSQLMIVFQKLYDSILTAKIEQELEIMLSFNDKITKLVTFPFAAYQANGASRFLLSTNHFSDYMNFEEKISTFLKKAKMDNF